MRLLIAGFTAGLWLIVPAKQPPPTVITNVTVIDGTGGRPRVANVAWRNSTIDSVSPAAPAAGSQVIDGTGRFLIPGLWDMHVHLATRPEPELAERMLLPAFLAYGVVGVRDMGGPIERTLALRAQTEAGTIAGPRILTPGPFIDGPGEESGMFRRPGSPAAVADAIASLQASRVDFVKVQAALSPATHRAVVEASIARGLQVAGHIPIAMTAEEVIDSGQRTIEHISPALVGDGLLLLACSSRAAELIAELREIESERSSAKPEAIAAREAELRRQVVATYDPALARRLGRRLRDKKVWIVPTLIWSDAFRPQSRSADGQALPMDLVPAALRTRWLQNRKADIGRTADPLFGAIADVARTARQAVRDLRAGGARVLAGTDTFDAFVLPGHSLHQELNLLVQAGLSPAEALDAATSEAARYRGSDEAEGTIAPGKRADLVLLDADPLSDIANASRVRATIVGGRLYDRAALDRLLEGVRAFAAAR